MTYMRDKDGTVFSTDYPTSHPERERLTNAEGKKARAFYCREELRKLLKPGDEVLTILRHVSRSGMMRHIDCLTMVNGDVRNITKLVADATGVPTTNDCSLKVSGCGMDMGFSVVYDLGARLWPEGFECIGDRCPAADHSNGDRDRTPHNHGKGQGGYALRQRWL